MEHIHPSLVDVNIRFQMNKSTFTKIEENRDNKNEHSEKGTAAIVFSLKNEVGGLVKALKLFQVSMELLYSQ